MELECGSNRPKRSQSRGALSGEDRRAQRDRKEEKPEEKEHRRWRTLREEFAAFKERETRYGIDNFKEKFSDVWVQRHAELVPKYDVSFEENYRRNVVLEIEVLSFDLTEENFPKQLGQLRYGRRP